MHLVARPIMRLRRDEEGHLLEVGGDDGRTGVADSRRDRPHHRPRRARAAPRRSRARPRRRRAAVEDWQAMRARCTRRSPRSSSRRRRSRRRSSAEARALLQWMHDDHFTFLGYREYEIRTEGGEDVLASVEGNGPRHPPRQGRAAALAQLLQADAGGARLARQKDAAEPDQGELAVDRAPARPTSTTSA